MAITTCCAIAQQTPKSAEAVTKQVPTDQAAIKDQAEFLLKNVPASPLSAGSIKLDIMRNRAKALQEQHVVYAKDVASGNKPWKPHWDNQNNIYDLDNRIKEVQMDSNTDVEMVYDAFGRRVHIDNGSDETFFTWWGDQEVAEHEHNSTLQNDLWAHPTALNKIRARAVEGSKYKLEWYHKNYLDHVYAVSDDNGNITERYRYNAFGEVEIYNITGTKLTTSAIDNKVTSNSRRYGSDTKLHYYKY